MFRKKILAVLFCTVFMMQNPSSVFAADQDIPYLARIPFRILRGVANLGLGWTEIFLRPFGEHQTESAGEALAMGAANTLIRAGVGVTDIVTFWVPDIQMLDMYPDWQGWPYLFHWS